MREETRKRILKRIEEMDYHPNLMASALTGKGTQTLGLMVPDISNPFFSTMARSIEDFAHEQGMSVIMCSTDDDPEKEKKYMELLRRKQVDGFIVASNIYNKDILQELIESNVPVIMLSYDDASLDVSKVSVDDFKGGYEAASHLYACGHRNIAIIGEHTHSSEFRIYGCKVSFEARNIELNKNNIYKTTASIQNGKAIFEKIFQRPQKDWPTAIFACNDLLAIGVIQGATERGISIPNELAIIGFDNTILAVTTIPGLTTIAQPIEKMAKKTVDILVEEIKEKKRTKRRILFNPELIVRGTTPKFQV